MVALTRLLIGSSAVLLCLVSAVKNDAAPNRNGVNCVLAPPGDQSDSSSSSSQKNQTNAGSSADDASGTQNSNQKNSSENANAGGKSQASASSSSSQSSSAKLLTNSGKSGNAASQASKSSSTKSVNKNSAKSGDASSNSKEHGDVMTNQDGSSAQILDATAPDAVAAQVTAKPGRNTSSKTKSNSASASSGSGSSSGSSSSSSGSGSSGSSNGSSGSAKKSGFEIPGAILVASDDSENFGTKFDNSKWVDRGEKNDQGNVWKELDSLRGRETMSAGEIQDLLAKAVPGKDYPTFSSIPTTSFRCENVKQAGFYADPETRCQVIRRCDINGIKWNYLCPNATLFNQITLTCDWYFNIDCSKAVQFYDYSNSRLYHSDWLLLDTPPESQV